MKSRIMYVERKDSVMSAEARIGRVTFSKTGRTLHYQGKQFQTLAGTGFKSNYYDIVSGEEYWISGCKRNGADALYSAIVEIDEDVREEYWTMIRNQPESKGVKSVKCKGKYSK